MTYEETVELHYKLSRFNNSICKEIERLFAPGIYESSNYLEYGPGARINHSNLGYCYKLSEGEIMIGKIQNPRDQYVMSKVKKFLKETYGFIFDRKLHLAIVYSYPKSWDYYIFKFDVSKIDDLIGLFILRGNKLERY